MPGLAPIPRIAALIMAIAAVFSTGVARAQPASRNQQIPINLDEAKSALTRCPIRW